MNLRHVRWGDYILTADPPLPYDVTFRVFSLQDDSHYQQVSAHKLLLATSSEVFHAQFFGALADNQRVVDIKETTFNAFKFLLLYIYQGIDVKITHEEAQLEEVLEILNLAEKYGMSHLVNEITAVLREELVVTEENVEEVSETAQTYSCFEKVALVLQEKCETFYRARQLKEERRTEVEAGKFPASSVRSSVGGPEYRSVTVVESSEDLTDLDQSDTWMEPDPSPDFSQTDQETQVQARRPSETEIEAAKMSLKYVAWVNLLDTNTTLPPDVTFKFFEMKSSHRGGKEEEVRQYVGEVKAHKLLLACCSQVFKEKFFNSNNDVNELIVEDSSIRAFKIMVDFIYGRFPKLRGGPDICEMFEIVNVADKYRVAGLKEEYKSSMLLYFRYR